MCGLYKYVDFTEMFHLYEMCLQQWQQAVFLSYRGHVSLA